MEEIWLRIASTHEYVILLPGVWVIQRMPNPTEGQAAQWIKLVTDDGLIVGCAEEALLGNYPTTVDIID